MKKATKFTVIVLKSWKENFIIDSHINELMKTILQFVKVSEISIPLFHVIS